MSKKQEKGKVVLISGCIWVFTLLVMLAFYIGKEQLPNGVEYKVWLQMAGTIWSLLVMPLSFLVFLLSIMWKLVIKKHIVLGTVLTVTALFVFMMYAIFAVILIWVASLDMGTETKYAEGIIRTEKQDEYSQGVTNSVTVSVYHEDMGLFLKKEYEPASDIVLIYLEEKYGEKFKLSKESIEGEAVYRVYPEANSSQEFLVREFLGFFKDDYSVIRAKFIMDRAIAENCPERSVETQEKLLPNTLSDRLTIDCNGREDAKACAGDIAMLISTVLKDDFFLEEGRSIMLVVNCIDEEDRAATTYLYFGNEADGRAYGYEMDGIEYGYEADYYTDETLIYKELQSSFDWLENMLAEEKKMQAYEDDLAKANLEKNESSPDYVEGAYKFLYESLFADSGYPYDCRHNAKGNFYAFLCDGEEQPEHMTEPQKYTETIVYDRLSKNEKCHLFVYYRNYDSYSTILEMYAVDRESGEVYISGRRAWEDVGTKEYCEATGEP